MPARKVMETSGSLQLWDNHRDRIVTTEGFVLRRIFLILHPSDS